MADQGGRRKGEPRTKEVANAVEHVEFSLAPWHSLAFFRAAENGVNVVPALKELNNGAATIFEIKVGWEVFLRPLHLNQLGIHFQLNIVKVDALGNLLGHRKGRGKAGRPVYLQPANLGTWRLREAKFDLVKYSDSGSPETASYRLDRDLKDRQSGGQEPLDLEIAKWLDAEVPKLNLPDWSRYLEEAMAEYKRAKDRQLSDRLCREAVTLAERTKADEQRAALKKAEQRIIQMELLLKAAEGRDKDAAEREKELSAAVRAIASKDAEIAAVRAKAETERQRSANLFAVYLPQIRAALEAVVAGRRLSATELRFVEVHDCPGGYRLRRFYREGLSCLDSKFAGITATLLTLAEKVEREPHTPEKIDFEAAAHALVRINIGEMKDGDRDYLEPYFKELAENESSRDPTAKDFLASLTAHETLKLSAPEAVVPENSVQGRSGRAKV